MAETLSLTVHPSVHLYNTRVFNESNPTNAYTNASSTTYATYNAKASTTSEYYIYYNFDLSAIPQDSEITKVSCVVKCAQRGFTTSRVMLCAGTSSSNVKGTAQTYTGTSVQTITIQDCGEWTRAELDKLTLYFQYYANSMPQYANIYGADLTIEYQEKTSGVTGTVTIGSAAKELVGGYVNIGGTWKEIVKQYTNIGGVWKE